MNNRRNLVIKRWFDATMSLWGLVVFAPMFVIVSLIVKLSSESSVCYIAPKVSLYGKLFNLYKFRTKFVNANKKKKASITVDVDKCITLAGRILRKTKIDELPSLLHVLKDDISFVEPRPDVKGYADCLKGLDRFILNLKPGITAPSTLKHANEEVFLATVDAPARYNNEVFFPDKVRFNFSYLKSINLFTDLKLILRTIFSHFLFAKQ